MPYDYPNLEVLGLDPPWVEGTGGGSPEIEPPNGLDAMTKEQLVAYAAEKGYDIDASTTKAEIKAAIQAAGG